MHSSVVRIPQLVVRNNHVLYLTINPVSVFRLWNGMQSSIIYHFPLPPPLTPLHQTPIPFITLIPLPLLHSHPPLRRQVPQILPNTLRNLLFRILFPKHIPRLSDLRRHMRRIHECRVAAQHVGGER